MAEECGIRTFKSKKRRGVRRNIYAKFASVSKKMKKMKKKEEEREGREEKKSF